ncbi:hypothetical protein TNCV_2889761 [Trichonephila clavipes]|nr:hypothetical protein TNCV_2889761 [Trichonephila clavipes]
MQTRSSIDIPISAGNISSNFFFRNHSLALEQRGLQDSFPTPPVPRRIFSVRDITTVSLTDRDIKNSLTPSYSTLADTFQRVGPAGADSERPRRKIEMCHPKLDHLIADNEETLLEHVFCKRKLIQGGRDIQNRWGSTMSG